jgi:hypothetical protein
VVDNKKKYHLDEWLKIKISKNEVLSPKDHLELNAG